jgi:hypothetical protein
MTKIAASTIAGLLTIALASPAAAAHRHKRVHSETGPLIVSGILASQPGVRRARAAAKCVPVTIRLR